MGKGQEVLAAVREEDAAKLQALLAEDPTLAASRDENGVSMRLLAAYHRKSELLNLLLVAEQPLDVFEAAAFGREARLEELLAADPARARAWSADGFTPLHLAAFFGQPACARRLLEAGADPSAVAKNAMAVTPLHSAAASRQTAIAEMLLARGAEVDARQQGGWTALHAAAQHGDDALAELLLSHGAEPGLRSDDGKAAADLAAEKGHRKLADRLSQPREK